MAENNRYEGPADGSRLESYAWLPSAGFARPGRYRVFLRYLDLEREVAYAATFSGPELELAARRDDDPLTLPRAPIVRQGASWRGRPASLANNSATSRGQASGTRTGRPRKGAPCRALRRWAIQDLNL
jgi:hypothetical protein